MKRCCFQEVIDVTPSEETQYIQVYVIDGVERWTVYNIKFEELKLVPDPLDICDAIDITVSMDNSGSFSDFNWSTGETTPSIVVDKSGLFAVTATKSDGCVLEKEFTVTEGCGFLCFDYAVTEPTPDSDDLATAIAHIESVTGIGTCIYVTKGRSEPTRKRRKPD